jgi:FkbH-like protein
MSGRVLLVTDFLADNLGAQLERRGLEPVLAPFDAVEPTLRGASDDADYALVWTRLERSSPAFARLLGFEAVDFAEIEAEIRAFCALLRSAAPRWRAVFVARWTLPASRRGLGLLELHPAHGAGGALLRANALLAELLAEIPGAYLLDAERWMASAGVGATSPKLWYLSKTPFDPKVFATAAADVDAAVRGLRGQARKLLILDLDNTLWSGIVGEDGWEGLRLGGHDPIGEALVDFQRKLKALANRGILLAVASKNDEAVALEAIRSHPEMVLRLDDLAGWRINWSDKAANIAALVEDLGLGLQSAVFIDDQPHERARVAEALPEVLVPDWPADKLLYGRALDALDCFDAPALTGEDRARSGMYRAERHRRALQTEVSSHEDWLASLGIEVHVEPCDAANLTRIAQLVNKTNQLNLATRRMTETEMAAWAATPGNALVGFRVTDRFGDSGLCGVLGLSAEGETARVTDFLLSCRVMGRRVEETILATAVARARAAGARRVEATFAPTKKNAPTLAFFEKTSGFEANGHTFGWDVARDYPVPGCVTLREASGVERRQELGHQRDDR